MSKVAYNSTTPNKKMGRVGVAKLYVPNTTLYVLSRMVLT